MVPCFFKIPIYVPLSSRIGVLGEQAATPLAKAFTEKAFLDDVANCGQGGRDRDLSQRFAKEVVVSDVLVIGDIAENRQACLLGELL
jgi:hypothetical protein